MLVLAFAIAVEKVLQHANWHFVRVGVSYDLQSYAGPKLAFADLHLLGTCRRAFAVVIKVAFADEHLPSPGTPDRPDVFPERLQ